jgi:hypothetical protein
LNRKRLVVGLILLLIGTSVISSTAQHISTTVSVQTCLLMSQSENWNEMQKLLAADGTVNNEFGYSVSLAGGTALIGAYKEASDGNSSGSAYVFTRNNKTWTQQAKLIASDSAAEDKFGYSVFLSDDTALIGAIEDDDNGVDSGSAYVFTFTGTTWIQEAKLLASDGSAEDHFGYSVSLSGNTALIAAALDDDKGDYSGSVYVFTRTGTIWTQQAKLLASDGTAWDYFGWSVSLAGDSALIGAPSDDDNGESSGSAYVFSRTGTIWSLQAKLLASDGTAWDCFGRSVSLSSDTALIGAPFHDNGMDSGSTYIFTRTGSTWMQQAKIHASDSVDYTLFGCSVSLFDNTALIGASNAAYIFTCTGINWTKQAKLLPSDITGGDFFGWSVSLDDNTALIGAYLDDDNGVDSGSAYVFTKNQPPNPPTITGPVEGKIKIATEYNFTTTDPDGDQVSYYIDWGDNTSSIWIGPYASGDVILQSHTWTTKGTYTIKAKTKDIYGNESGWGMLQISMPLSFNTPRFGFFEWLFEVFPHAFLVLRQMRGY